MILFNDQASQSMPEFMQSIPVAKHSYFNGSSKPYVRWWWLNGAFVEDDIASQLDWIKAMGFGGVEIAWLKPNWLDKTIPPSPEWLSTEWSEAVAMASELAIARGLGCDLTFGSCWPFAASYLSEEDTSQTFSGSSSQRLFRSWENFNNKECRILNHLSEKAFASYARPLLDAMQPAIKKGSTALFCDSLEVDMKELWDVRLWKVFEERFGYQLESFSDSLDNHPDVRYDYRKLIADVLFNEFYKPFTVMSHKVGAISRVQCHGSLTDLLSSYGDADIPESEALLFEPHFSRIPASAAALTRKPVVSSETFTCIYGYNHFEDPALGRLRKKEDIYDLKLLADAVIANGVNQIIWHGMPYNQSGEQSEFYTSVHVGPDSGFVDSLASFNDYLTNICSVMQAGKPFSQMALYLPNEDNWMDGKIPEEDRTLGALERWEMRHVAAPADTVGYHPLWISLPFLQSGKVEDGLLHVGDIVFEALYVDVVWIDYVALVELHRLADDGLTLIIKKRPKQPGHCPHVEYENIVNKLFSLPTVLKSIADTEIVPFIVGENLPFYWARQCDDEIYVFLAHPAAQNISYPMGYKSSHSVVVENRELCFSWGKHTHTIVVSFGQHESILLRLDNKGIVKNCI